MKHIAVFASGAGSNSENLIRHFNENPDAGKVELIVCNRPEAGVIERAARLNVPVAIISPSDLRDASVILPLLRKYSINLIVLAGFLMMIPPYLTREFHGRMLNVHPSLLPAYGGKGMYGRHVHEAVIAAGETQSGITVHLVTDVYDVGEYIFQAKVDILPHDTPATLEAKIHFLERIHLPRIIENFKP